MTKALSVRQSQNCELCRAIKHQALAYSNAVSVVTTSQGFSRAHLRVVPTSHYTILQQVPVDILTLMILISNITAALLFEFFTKQGVESGTNILIRNGIPAGQVLNHTSIEVISRFNGDKPILAWEPLKLSKAELDEIRNSLEEHIRVIIEQFNKKAQNNKKAAQKQTMASTQNEASNNKGDTNKAYPHEVSEAKSKPDQKREAFSGKTPWDRIP